MACQLSHTITRFTGRKISRISQITYEFLMIPYFNTSMALNPPTMASSSELAERLGLGAFGARGAPSLFHIFFELRLSAEDVVIVLGEAVGFIAQILQQFQAHVIAGEANGSIGPGRRAAPPFWRAR
jgi:hypothetical protein